MSVFPSETQPVSIGKPLLLFQNERAIHRVVCAIVFCLFSLSYLYNYQSDILAVTVHTLSDGQIHYPQTAGAFLLTAVLVLLQRGVFALTKLKGAIHSLTYFPSFLLLTAITTINPASARPTLWGGWLITFLLLLAVFVGAVWRVKQSTRQITNVSKPISCARSLCINLLLLSLFMLLTGMLSTGNDVFHYRIRMEQYLLDGKNKQALTVGKRSLATDSSLTMLRVYALSLQHALPEHLFEYPLTGTSAILLPDKSHVHTVLLPEADIYCHLGGTPSESMPPITYLKQLEVQGRATPAVKDYILCGYLLDKDLETFVRTIGRYYDLKGELPKHYKEALTLYTHLRANPFIVYHNAVMDTDYQDLQSIERQYPDKRIRGNKIRDTYNNTYWYYYLYGNEK